MQNSIASFLQDVQFSEYLDLGKFTHVIHLKLQSLACNIKLIKINRSQPNQLDSVKEIHNRWGSQQSVQYSENRLSQYCVQFISFLIHGCHDKIIFSDTWLPW